MALINCKECGKEISDTAKTCPHCGAKNKDSIYINNATSILARVFAGISILINPFRNIGNFRNYIWNYSTNL